MDMTEDQYLEYEELKELNQKSNNSVNKQANK